MALENCRRRITSQFTKKLYSTQLFYEIPERYRNSFYLANASLFDSTNWFLHKAFEVAFPALKNELKDIFGSHYDGETASKKLYDVIGILDQCNSIIDVRFPLKRDSGFYEIIRGFRAQYGLVTGNIPCLGGLRLDNNITRDHMKGLSVLSNYKNACMGINLSGSHGGIKISPKEYSELELQKIVEQYTVETHRKGYLGVEDMVQPDINTSEKEMNWICQTFSNYNDHVGNVAAMGKSVDLGGIPNYEKTASQGAFYALEIFLNNDKILEQLQLDKGLKGKTFIIQGLGKVGASLAMYLEENEAKCVGIKESDGYLYEENGIDLKELFAHKEKRGSYQNFGKYKPYPDDEIYGQSCDILIFAAYQKSLICYMADKVKAKVIVEAADGPLMPTSHKILLSHSKLVLPDIYTCAGATIASYIEYIRYLQHVNAFDSHALRNANGTFQNIFNMMSSQKEQQVVSSSTVQKITTKSLDAEVISNSIEYVLTETAKEINNILETYRLGLDVRTAAYIHAIRNMFQALYRSNKFF